MIEDENNQAIKAQAHQIWEAEGRPEGREQEHWFRAAREIEQARTVGGDSPPDPDLPGSPGTASNGFESAAAPATRGPATRKQRS